ncbi:taste receptor type 2 member 9-like [Pseudophryne corroboree]|uniref:taste receptor type 2 member 9-like n=1 Tax=Pseudophryne corroboree TaxID=495146 RepID=UPI003081EBAC
MVTIPPPKVENPKENNLGQVTSLPPSQLKNNPHDGHESHMSLEYSGIVKALRSCLSLGIIMPSATVWGFTALMILVCLLSLTTNGFVLGVYLLDRIHSLPNTRADMYMFSTASSNFCLQIWSTASWICAFTQDKDSLCLIANAFKIIASSSSLLLAASLCMFYCSRIVVCKNSFIRRIQIQITRYYRFVIFGAIFLCTLMGLPLIWDGDNSVTIPCNSSIVPCTYMCIYRSVLVFFGYTMPLIYMLLSAGLILRSLNNHMRKMNVTLKTGHEVRMEAHLKAGHTVTSLLLLFIVYFVLSLLSLTEIVPQDSPLQYIFYLSPMLYSFVNGLVIIRGNSKLRRTAAGIMQKLQVVKG